MNKFLIVLFWAVLCSIGCSLLIGCDADRKPDIVFESTSHEFPNPFIVGANIVKTFDFINAGNLPLEIRKIRTNCGCVATNTTAKEIPPEGIGTIQLSIEQGAGHFRQKAYVHTNDPETPVISLEVSGVIRPVIDYPNRIYMGEQIEKGAKVTKTLTFTNNLADAVEIASHKVSDDRITVKVPTKIIPAGGSVEVEVVLSMENVGSYSESLTLYVIGKEKTELVSRFQGRVLGGIVALPANLFLGVLSPKQVVQHTIELKTDSGQAFSLLNIAADNFTLSTELPTENGTTHEVRLSLSVDHTQTGLVKGTIHIQTDHPEVPQIDIPVRGVLR